MVVLPPPTPSDKPQRKEQYDPTDNGGTYGNISTNTCTELHDVPVQADVKFTDSQDKISKSEADLPLCFQKQNISFHINS